MNNIRLIGTFAVLLFILHIARGQVKSLLADPTIWPPDDYVEYWAAGHLNLYGGNPYSEAELLPLEIQAGRKLDEAVMMWNPPWTLTFVMPLGAMHPREGQLLWFVLSFLSIGLSAFLLWELYCGLNRIRWVAFAISFAFIPTLFLLQSGQITGFVLLGIVLFTYCMKRGYEYAAGAAACLVAIKPHLAYLLWVALLIDAWIHWRWKTIIGGIVCGIILSAIPTLLNPHVWQQYVAAYETHPPKQHVSLTIGVALRLLFGEQHFWLQFVPVPFGLACLAWIWRRTQGKWDWSEQMPLLLLVSFVTAPYGAWHFDIVLMLFPILQRAAKFSIRPLTSSARAGIAILLLMNGIMIALMLINVWTYMYCWVAPLVLVLYCSIKPGGVAYQLVDTFAIPPRTATV